MALSLLRFLKITDSDMLSEYFKHRWSGLADIVDSGAKKAACLESLEAQILELSHEEQSEILRDFDLVQQLTSDIGQRELRQVLASRRPRLLDHFDRIESAQGRGLLVFLEDHQGFERALVAEHVEARREKSQWSSFNIRSGLQISTAEDATGLLVASASRLFQNFDGSGRSIELSRLDRPLLAPNGEPGESLVQINLNIEGQPKSDLVFKSGVTNRLVQFPAIEAAIIYQPQSGVLAVTSRGGRPMHLKLAKAFTEHLLRSDDVPVRVELRLVHLDKLRRPMAFDREPRDGIESVRVTKLRLFSEDHGHRRVQLDLGPNAEESIIEFGQQAFPNDNPLTDDTWEVKSGEIKFKFAATGGQRRGQTMAVGLSHPNGCNIRERRLERQAMAEKYLK